MRVQIVVINGDFDHDHRGQWTKKDFDTKIVHGRPQKGQLLSGELKFRLQNGVGYLSSVKFQDNSSFVPSKKFKLGVMAADERISERIQEGITESFAVKDVRGYIAKKNPNPSPRDAVYKLSKIAKSGDRHKLLEQNGIKTVEDFLSFYQKSPGDLRKILGKISDQDWDLIIGHAQKCNPRPGVYSSFLQESNVSHEHQALFGSNGRYYLQGSCSMHPSHMLQAQLDVQATQQQISSEYNGLSSGGLPVTVPNSSNFQPETLYQNLMHHGQLEGTQVVGQQVSSVGNEVLPASSLDVSSSQQQQHSLECNRTPDQLDGNGLSHVNLSDWQPLQELWLDGHVDTQWDSSGNALSASAEGLVNEFTGWRQPSIPVTPGSGGSCGAAEQNYWGHSPVSEAGSINYNGISAVSEAAGNRSHGHRGLSPSPSPARGAAGSRRHRALSFSPARGAGNVRRRALSFSPGRGARSSSNGWPPLPPGPPSWWTDNASNTSADCTDEEYCLDG